METEWKVVAVEEGEVVEGRVVVEGEEEVRPSSCS